MTIVKKTDRHKLARLIIICHSILILVLVFLLISDSILTIEFTPLLTLLLPITTIYGGTVFRYIEDRIKNGKMDFDQKPVPFYSFVRKLIIVHFLVMLGLLLAKTVFNWIEFSMMITLMTLFESAFGAYLGSINNAVFHIER